MRFAFSKQKKEGNDCFCTGKVGKIEFLSQLNKQRNKNRDAVNRDLEEIELSPFSTFLSKAMHAKRMCETKYCIGNMYAGKKDV